MTAFRVTLLMSLTVLAACTDEGLLPTDLPPADVISIDPTAIEIVVGETAVVRLSGVSTRLPALWASDNPEIASVTESGLVRGNQPGTTYITARVNDLVATAQVTVRASDRRDPGRKRKVFPN